MTEDREFTFQITCKVTAATDTDAFRLLAPALDTIRALDIKRGMPEVELLAENPVWYGTTRA